MKRMGLNVAAEGISLVFDKEKKEKEERMEEVK